MSGTDPVFWVLAYLALVMLAGAAVIAFWDELKGDDR